MAKLEINKELIYQRSKSLSEATYALASLALSGHDHCTMGNYPYSIQLTVYSHSDSEAQEIYEILRELLHDDWKGEIQAFTDDEPHFWTTQFTYHLKKISAHTQD